MGLDITVIRRSFCMLYGRNIDGSVDKTFYGNFWFSDLENFFLIIESNARRGTVVVMS